jgi:phosphate/sulfate permease
MESKFLKIQLPQPYLLLELLAKLFIIGVFSVEGGIKAWFECILLITALCGCGYLIWWQIPFLVLVIILSPIVAGLFCLTIPQYVDSKSLTANDQVISALKIISVYNLNEISTLSGASLDTRLEQLLEAKKILQDNPGIFDKISKLQSVFDDINQTYEVANETIEYQHEVDAERNREFERQRQRDEERRKREQDEKLRRDKEVYQAKLKEEAIKDEQEKIKQKERDKEQQEEIERQHQRAAWIREERRKANYTGGCPPDRSSGEARCPPGYPVKVTSHKTEDGYDGIIWQKKHKKYPSIKPEWCYRSIQEAEAEREKYRFRKPKYPKE